MDGTGCLPHSDGQCLCDSRHGKGSSPTAREWTRRFGDQISNSFYGITMLCGLFDKIYDVEHAFKTAKEAINGDPGEVDGVRTNQYVHARLMTEWLKNGFPDETDEWYDESGCLTDWYVIAFMIESGIIKKRSSS